MKISVVIPCFNEIKTISEIIKRVEKALNKYQFEVLVIDDCSTDGSVALLEKLKLNNKNVRVIFNSKNLGKGASLRKDLMKLWGKLFVFKMQILNTIQMILFI